MLQNLFLHYGNLAGFFMLVLGFLFYAFSNKAAGIILLLAGAGFLAFYYIF